MRNAREMAACGVGATPHAGRTAPGTLRCRPLDAPVPCAVGPAETCIWTHHARASMSREARKHGPERTRVACAREGLIEFNSRAVIGF